MPFTSLVNKKLTKILKILEILKIGDFCGFFGLFWGCFGLFSGFSGVFWRIFSGYPLFLGISVRISSGYPLDKIRMKNRPKIRKIRRVWSGFRKIRIHPLVGTPDFSPLLPPANLRGADGGSLKSADRWAPHVPVDST